MARLPRAVQQQVTEANKIIDQIKNGANPQPAQSPPDPGTATAAPQPTNLPPTIALAPDNPVAPVVEPTAQPDAPLAMVEDDFEHKYKVLQGKYNAEVPRLTRQVTELIERSTNLERVLAEFASHNATAVPTNAPVAPAATRITTEERAEWGSELIDLIGRRAQEVLDNAVQNFETRIKTLEGGVSTVVAKVGKSDQDRVYQKLDAEVPSWEAVNNSPEFLAWLNNFDSYSGFQRGKMLTQAFASNDGERVVSFFKGFLKEYATVAPTPPASVTPNGNGTPAVDLRTLAAPGRPMSGVNPADGAQPQKRIWTTAEISQFYDACRRGVFKGRDDERNTLERDIVAATAEGRVR